MKSIVKKLAVSLLAVAMILTLLPATNASAAAKPKLNKKSATIYVGKTVSLKLKNNKKKVKWTSSNKKVATVSNKGKVKGKKAGKATITAKVGNKKYKCKITVKAKKKHAKHITYTTTSVKKKIANACMDYGKFKSDSDGDYYYLDNIVTTSDLCVYVQVRYIPSDDIIKIESLSGTSSSDLRYLVEIVIENVNDSTCSVTFYDDGSSYGGSGILYKNLLDNESAVTFTSSNMSSSLEYTAEKLTTATTRLMLLQFNEIMSSWNVGVTYNDLGFYF